MASSFKAFRPQYLIMRWTGLSQIPHRMLYIICLMYRLTPTYQIPRVDKHLTQTPFIVTLGPPALCLKGKPPLLNTDIWWLEARQLGKYNLNLCNISLCVSGSSLIQLPQHPAQPGSQLLHCTLQLEKLGRKMSRHI